MECPLGKTDIECTDCHESDYVYVNGRAQWRCTISCEHFEPAYRNLKKVDSSASRIHKLIDSVQVKNPIDYFRGVGVGLIGAGLCIPDGWSMIGIGLLVTTITYGVMIKRTHGELKQCLH